MMRIDEFANGRLELANTAVHAAAQRLVRQLREPALRQIQPRPIGGCEVDVEARRFASQFRINIVMCVP